eukprot:SAG31_NODE_1_length_62978_cov_30.836130_4_plen_130_part_00
MTRTKNLALLALGALLAGLGKGGLGGFGAASVAVYSQTSDETIAKRMALYVLTTYGCDMLALLLHWQDFQPSAITQLLPIAMLGVTIGNQFAGYISENHFRWVQSRVPHDHVSSADMRISSHVRCRVAG